MVFERLDGPFGCIRAVIVRFDELHLASFGSHEGFYGGRGLIVCDGKSGRESVRFEAVENCGVRCHDAAFEVDLIGRAKM